MQLLDKKELNFTPILIISNTVLLALLLLMAMINTGQLGKLANSKTPTLVELNDGTSARVAPAGHNERSLQTISDFVGRAMVNLMSWNALPKSDELDPLKKPQLDSGVQVGDKKITTKAWATGFALSEDFRAPFLKELGNLTPNDIFNGTTQSALIVRYLREPEKLNEGKWQIDMVANLVIFQNGDQVGKAISFNKSIFVRAIDTPPLPPNASDLQVATYRARQAGMEIYKIQDLDLGK
ncbi:hypothetical protein H6G97_20900 [Nostoc flagelliforme FACHB-838]|uniref:Uncharacterized protein n=1 Tax=Nostoc flagelliforme FACHB-838 TaxID=2692904 RepID=A0ABR8DR16_9NOSO|nr:hypothetical protein [Nostoc flagelliforme]MBD2531909.1 hypothetical protein [Nostoc flagelliforme FACHB-838]